MEIVLKYVEMLGLMIVCGYGNNCHQNCVYRVKVTCYSLATRISFGLSSLLIEYLEGQEPMD